MRSPWGDRDRGSVTAEFAVALPATRALLPDATALDPLAIDYATTAAATGSLLLLGVSAGRMTLLRGLELGVGDRARGAAAVIMTGGLVALSASAIDVAPPDRVVPTTLAITSMLVTWATSTRDPATVTSALRGFLAIVILGGRGHYVGALIGGFMLAILENLVSLMVPNGTAMVELAAYGLMIFVLLIRPGGLMGVKEA